MVPESALRSGILGSKGLGADKVKAGMDKKRLEYYKKKLLARREELTKTIARTQEEGRTADEDPTVDLADKAANSYTKEFRSEEHTSELQSHSDLVCRLLLEKKNKKLEQVSR